MHTSWGRRDCGPGGGKEAAVTSKLTFGTVVKVLEEIANDLGKNTSEKTFHCCLRDFQNSLVTLTFDKFLCG